MYEQSPFDKAGPPRSKIGFRQFFVGFAVFVVALVILMNAVVRPALQAAHATPTARPTPTGPASTATLAGPPPVEATAAALGAGAVRLFGPADGVLTQTNNLLAVRASDQSLSDFLADVEFVNPPASTKTEWDYGIYFRHLGANHEYRLYVDYLRAWRLEWVDAPPSIDSAAATPEAATPTAAPLLSKYFHTLTGGISQDLKTGAGEANRLRLIVCGSDGYFLINDHYVATLDLSEHQDAGDVVISTGFELGDDQAGRQITYRGFEVERVDCGESDRARPGEPTATVFGVPAATPTALPPETRASLFTAVWQSVKDHYLYPDFHGANWDTIRTTYEARAQAADSAPAYYAVLDDMIKQLKDNHSHYLAPWEVSEEDADIQGQTNYAGIGVRVSPDATKGQKLMYIFPDGGAAAAGLRRRDVIVAVDGQTFTDNAGWSSKIRGPVGTTVRLTVRSPSQAPRDLVVTRRHITGNIAPTGSRLVADPTIGFVVLPVLEAKEVPAQLEAELRTMLAGGPLHGIVLDLRGNEGGLIEVMQGVSSQFVSGQVGSYARRTGNTPLLVTKGALYDQLKAVPLVVLVDNETKSAAEMLAGALHAAGRASIVGVPTAGTTEVLFAHNFADGSRLWLAEAAFELTNGPELEGHGVPLDAQVNVDWINYTERDDPQILKALELLRRPALP